MQVSSRNNFSASAPHMILNQSGLTQTNFSLTNLNLNAAYYWRVRAFNAAGASLYSNVFNFRTTSSNKFKIGDQVRVTLGDLNVRSEPGLRKSNTIVGTQPTNALGTVVDGAVLVDGYHWWKIDYATGADGWSTENYLALSGTEPPPATFDFNLVNSGSVSLTPGGGGQTVTITATQTTMATPQTINFSVSGLATGVTASWPSGSSCTPSLLTKTCSVSASLTAAASATAGTTTVTARGVAGSLARTTSFAVGVGPAVVTPPITPILDFTVAVANTNLTLNQGNTANTNVTVNFTQSNATQTVTLAVSSLPTGVSAAFNPATCVSSASGPSTCAATVAFAALGSAVSGSYPITITATGGGLTKTANMTITISPILSNKFLIGDRVETTGSADVRSAPETGATALAGSPVPTGARGTITGGPQGESSNVWWKVKFDQLTADGWSLESLLKLFIEIIQPPTSTDFTVPLGVNLYAPWDSDRSAMFTDIIRFSRGFYSATDSEGWPTGENFLVYVMSDDSAWPDGARKLDVSGVFTLAFNGRADVGIFAGYGSLRCPAGKTCDSAYNGGRVYYDAGRNLSVTEVLFNPVTYHLQAYALDFKNARRSPTGAPGLTNVRLLRQGYASTDGNYTATQTFTNEFLTSIAPFKIIRLMDYMATGWCVEDRTPGVYDACNTDERKVALGSNQMLDWDERTKPDVRYTAQMWGGPIEWMVELANLTGKDLWINLQHVASDNFYEGLANYLKNGQTYKGVYYPPLNPNSKIYLEWSNEIWNFASAFGQGREVLEIAKAYKASGVLPSIATFDNSNNEYYEAANYSVKRTVDAANVFRRVFGDAAMMTRIRPIFASQLSFLLGGLDWAYKTYHPRPVSHYLYGIASAPYFSAPNATTATVDQMISGPGSVVDDINTRMGGEFNGTLRYTYYLSIAQAFGLKFIAYEGGSDFSWGGNTNLANRLAINYDSRFEHPLRGYLNQWFGCGGDAFLYFNFTSGFGPGGQWGLTDNVLQEATNMNPKMRGAKRVAESDIRTFDCAYIGNNYFAQTANGALGTGSGLTATYYSDNDFGTVAVTRIDPLVNFLWRSYLTPHPFPRLNRMAWEIGLFSVRWTGKIMPKFTGTYTFTVETDTDDAATLWINNQNLGKEGSINLLAGQKYDLRLDYQVNGPPFASQGKVRLWWSSTGGSAGNQVRAIVPRWQLFPN